MGASYQRSQIQNSKFRKELSTKQQNRSINGKTVNIVDSPDTVKIEVALIKSKISTNSDVSLNDAAKMSLGTMGCVLSSEAKSFSLVETCGDVETIDNEKIMDLSSYENTVAKTIPATDKFSVGNTFYNLDDAVPTDYVERNAAQAAADEADVVCFAAALWATSKTRVAGNMQTATTGSASTAAAAATTPTTTTTY